MRKEQWWMTPAKQTAAELPVILFATPAAWAGWLDEHGANAKGLWVRLGKKNSGIASIDYAQALEVALCYGWIDGQKRSYDEHSWLQKFTPRGPKSMWSKINRDKALALIEAGEMRPAGLAAVDAARQDGRWDAAYDSQSNATVPEDLQAALDANTAAAAFFATLNRTNRYAILLRIHQAKRTETRAKRIRDFVAMLERHEKIYP
jgi:uncharacterized protein YdeI (YjbR/CyaY-like superfamily)